MRIFKDTLVPLSLSLFTFVPVSENPGCVFGFLRNLGAAEIFRGVKNWNLHKKVNAALDQSAQ